MTKVVTEWVKKAEEDYQVSLSLDQMKPDCRDAICFHCQQAAEKYLKALLQQHGALVPKIHDLIRLLELLLPDYTDLRSVRRGLNTLTDYAVDYRYPGTRATRRQTDSALRTAHRVREAIRQRLGLDKRTKPAR